MNTIKEMAKKVITKVTKSVQKVAPAEEAVLGSVCTPCVGTGLNPKTKSVCDSCGGTPEK